MHYVMHQVGCVLVEMLTGKPPWSHFSSQISALFHIASSKELHNALHTAVLHDIVHFMVRDIVRDIVHHILQYIVHSILHYTLHYIEHD